MPYKQNASNALNASLRIKVELIKMVLEQMVLDRTSLDQMPYRYQR